MNRATSEIASPSSSKGRKFLNWLIFGSGSRTHPDATTVAKPAVNSSARTFGYNGNPKVRLEIIGGPCQFIPVEIPVLDARCHD